MKLNLAVCSSVAVVLAIVACASSEEVGDQGAPQPLENKNAVEDEGGAPPPSFGDGDGSAAEAAPPESTEPVDVVFTADNAYAFGWGNEASLANFESRPHTQVAGDIFNCPVIAGGSTCTTSSGCGPESYQVPAKDAPASAYLYVVAWADQSTTQGALGQFKRGTGKPLYTGDEVWEVCATGVEHNSSSPGPTKADVEAKITLCNDGSASVASRGWVNKDGAVTVNAVGALAIGEDNSRGRPFDPGGQPGDGVFPITCQKDPTTGIGIDPDARWMWYRPEGFSDEQAFNQNSGNATKTYLIFRVKAKDVPPSPIK